MLGIQRGEQQIDLPVTPALGADGSGRIGVQLTSRFTVTHTRASSISDAAYTAAIGLSRCFGVVLGGEACLCFSPAYLCVHSLHAQLLLLLHTWLQKFLHGSFALLYSCPAAA